MSHLDQLLQEKRPLVVGAISDPSVLLATVFPEECDLIELRLDALGTGEDVLSFCKRHAGGLPILLTARHPDEGGLNALTVGARSAALMALLEWAAAIDLELRSLGELDMVWAEAGARGVTRIASYHNFQSTPAAEELSSRIDAAVAAAADIGKLAFHLDGPRGLAPLTSVLRVGAPIPLSVMGMGPLAPASRLLAAQLGSVLNYGYLGSEPTAPGQRPAKLFKQVLAATPVTPVFDR
jgi:3-dehydroquinate dehydratase-1